MNACREINIFIRSIDVVHEPGAARARAVSTEAERKVGISIGDLDGEFAETGTASR